MATAVRMPRWGMIMEEGTLVSWAKEEGAPVEKGEALAVVESEKVTNEIEAPQSGLLARIITPQGESAEVGALIAVISPPGEPADVVDELIAADRSSRPEAGRPSPHPPEESEVAPSRPGRRISPAARRISDESRLDWRELAGTGPGGRIQVKDVQRALELRAAGPDSSSGFPASPSGGEARPLSAIRRTIARRTTKSIEAPQAALCREIDMTELLELRRGRPGLSLTAVLLRKVVQALQRVPVLNSRYENAVHVVWKDVHLGVVVAAPGGVLVPVIRGAQEKTVEEIDAALADLVGRARTRSLGTEDLEGSTFTVSNAGMLGVDLFQPLLNPPEVAALGIGRIRRRPAVVGEQIEPRSTGFFCLSTDHRVADADVAGEFLSLLEALCSRHGIDE